MNELPVWNPNLIQDCGQFEDFITQQTDGSELAESFLTDLRRSWAIGNDLSTSASLQNHKIHSEVTIPFAQGSFLHYCFGWLCTKDYQLIIDEWSNKDDFYRNLKYLTDKLRGSKAYENCNKQFLTMSVRRPVFRGHFISRGEYPVVELLFNSWVQHPNPNYARLALLLLHQLLEQYRNSGQTIIFRSSHLTFFNELRQTYTPVDENVNRDFFIPLLRNIHTSPDTEKVFKDRLEDELSKAERTGSSDGLQQDKYRGIILHAFQNFFLDRAKPAIFFGSDQESASYFATKFKEQLEKSPLDDLNRPDDLNRLEDLNRIDPSGSSPPTSEDERDGQPLSNKSGKKDEVEEIFTPIEAKTIGQVILDFNHTTYFATNPHLPLLGEPEEVFTLLDQGLTNKITKEPFVDLIIWLGFQIGASVQGVLNLQIHHVPRMEFGFNSDLSAIWRYRPQAQKTSKSNRRHNILLHRQTTEVRKLPGALAELLANKWRHGQHITLYDLAKEMELSGEKIENVKKSLGFDSIAWLQTARRHMLLAQGHPEAAAMLLQKNARSKLHSKCAYYSVVEKDVNLAGSPYAFDLAKFKDCIQNMLRYLTGEINSVSLCRSWNAWTKYLIFRIYLTTGGRPVHDAFGDLSQFTDDFDLLIIDDKDILLREPRRVVPICETLSREIKINYRNSLGELAKQIKEKLPTLAKGIDELCRTPSQSDTQSIPFFFLLSENGLQGVPPDITRIADFSDLQPNFLRHFVSNHCGIEDRDIIDGILGHENERVPVYGPSSLRVMSNDHQQVRDFAERILSELDIKQSLEFRITEKEIDVRAQNIPKLFGLELRRSEDRAARKSLFKKAIEDAKETAAALKKSSDSKANLNEIIGSVTAKAQREIQPSVHFDIYFYYFSRVLRKNAPDLPLRSISGAGRTVIEKIPADFAKNYSKYKSLHSELTKILSSNTNSKRKVNLEFLFVLSLIKLNGVTCKKAIRQVLDGHYLIGTLGDNCYIDIQFSNTTPHYRGPVRRHQLHHLSQQYYDRLSNNLSFSEQQYNAKKLGRQLLEQLRTLKIFDSTLSDKDELLLYIASLEQTHQLYEMPGCLADIASGATNHRSPNYQSFQQIMAPELGQIKIDQNQLAKIQALPTNSDDHAKSTLIRAKDEGMTKEQTPAESPEKIHDTSTSTIVSHIISISRGEPGARLMLEEEIKTSPSLTKRALVKYVDDIESRRPFGRPTLAISTKLNYYGRLANLFEVTDLEKEIDELQLEEMIETVDSYLQDRQQILQSAKDDLRQIRDYFEHLATINPSMAVKFESLSTIYNPATDLFSLEEREEMLRRCQRNQPEIVQAIYTILRRFGLRKKESLFVKPVNMHLLRSTPLLRVVGDRVFRPKFPTSNRYVLPAPGLNGEEKDLLIRIKNRKTELNSTYLADSSEIKTSEITTRLGQVIRQVARRGSLHTLRHSFADDLTYELFNCAVAKDPAYIKKSNALLCTTPQGITRKTLIAASRLLGHAGTSTILETYSHRAFDVIDHVYRQALINESELARDDGTGPYRFTLASRYGLVHTNPKWSGSEGPRILYAKDYILNTLQFLSKQPDNNKMDFNSDRNLIYRTELLKNEFKLFPRALTPRRYLQDKGKHLIFSSAFLERLSTRLKDSMEIDRLIEDIEAISFPQSSLTGYWSKFDLACNPLDNFTGDGRFVVRGSMLLKDLRALICVLNALTYFDYPTSRLNYQTNSNDDHDLVQQVLRGYCIKGESVTQSNLPKKSIKFNLEKEVIWVIGVRRNPPKEKTPNPFPKKELLRFALITHLLSRLY